MLKFIRPLSDSNFKAWLKMSLEASINAIVRLVFGAVLVVRVEFEGIKCRG